MNQSKIISIELLGKEDVYNMEVEKHHNYSVNGGLIIHNCIDSKRYADYTHHKDRDDSIDIKAIKKQFDQGQNNISAQMDW